MRNKTLFITLTILVFIPFSYFYLDRNIALYFLSHKEEYESIGDILSFAGESYWYFGAGIFGALFFRYFKKNELFMQRYLFILYANIFSGLLSTIIKNILGRIRPWGLRNGGDEYGFLLFQNFDMGFIEKMKYQFTTLVNASTTYTSFPSGHSTTLFTMAMALSLLFPKQRILWFFLAIFFVSGRVFASDHFLSDILAGALLGSLSTIYLYSKFKRKII